MVSIMTTDILQPKSGYNRKSMKVVDTISIAELNEMAEKMYGTLVKADIDVVKKIVIIDMDMHVDGEQELLENGSQQTDVWGINLQPAKFGTDEFIEFDSMINIRPRQNNLSRSVEDAAVRQKINDIISGAVHE